jgi:hypothetical protein
MRFKQYAGTRLLSFKQCIIQNYCSGDTIVGRAVLSPKHDDWYPWPVGIATTQGSSPTLSFANPIIPTYTIYTDITVQLLHLYCLTLKEKAPRSFWSSVATCVPCTVRQGMTSHLKRKQILLAQWINSCHQYSTNTDGLKHGHCIANCWFNSRLLSLVLQKRFKSVNYQVYGSKDEETLHRTRMLCWCGINVGVPQTMYTGCTGKNHYMKV